MLVLPCLVLTLSALALPGKYRRDVLGLLAGESDASDTSIPTHAVSRSTSPTSSPSQPPKPALATSQPPDTPPQWTPTQRTDFSGPTAAQAALASTSVPPASAESHPVDHSSRTWQIIGVAIIGVLFVATCITCAMCFDRLWKFIKDVFSCTSHPLVSEEEFIPDREKQSGDTRTLTPSPSDWSHHKAEPLHGATSVHTIRELPWNTDTKDWNKLYRHPSRRNDHPRSHPLPI